MRKRIMFAGCVCLLCFAGCVARPEEGPLPTLAPEAQEGRTENETSGESKEPGKGMSIGDILGGGVDVIRYVERARVEADENLVAMLKSAIEVACYDYISDGAKLPEEPVRFRYTQKLEELVDTYSSLREMIQKIVGEDEVTLSDEGGYIMVTISKKENGMPEVVVEIMHE